MSDWKYDLDEVGEDAEDAADAPPEPERPRIEPESPSLENTLFVVLGVVATLLVFARIAGLLG